MVRTPRLALACAAALLAGAVPFLAACGEPAHPVAPRAPATPVAAPSAAPPSPATAAVAGDAAAPDALAGAPERGSDGADAGPDAAPAEEAAKSRPEPPPIPPSTAVLHVGDSMVPQLARALRPRFREYGVRYEMRFEQSTFTSTWAGRMPALVAATQPHLVLVTLGGNELANPQPENHARFVRRIVESIGARPCIWITPPLWRDETGIFDVIQKNAAPCRFFETDVHVDGPIERVGDGIHPTPDGGVTWADALWPWLMDERVGGEQPWALRPGPPEEYAPRGRRSAPSWPSSDTPR